MSKTMKKMLVPKLRFPEFRDAGEWEETPLNQVAKRCKQKNSLNKLNRVLTNSAEFGVLDQRDFFDKDIANQSNLAGYYIVKKGDYVYNPRISKTAPVGPISKNNIGDGVMSPLYTVFRFNNYDNNFYAHYFNSTCWHHYMRQASSTGARHDRMAISNDDFMALPLPISSLEEQQKIADCLSSIDELISTQSQKVEALKIHKKGLMQQLFPREGETVPRLRFPEFRDAGEWEIHKIEEACEKPFSGGTPPTTNKNYYGGKIPFIRSGEIDKNVTELFLSDAGLVNSSAKLVQKGDVLVALYGANSGEVALGKINGAINQAVICLRSRTSNAFLYQYLAFKKDEITAKYLQGGQGNLSGDIIKSIELLFSKDLEQQKIASCLSSIDDLITTQSQKLETLKTHKKGLMQQLFPAADE